MLFYTTSAPDIEHADVNMAIVYATGLGLPDRDYYFREDPKSVELRTQYVEHICKVLQLAGAPVTSADAATVMRLETALAGPQLDLVARRDPSKVNHRIPLNDLKALTPGFDWAAYLKGIGAPAFTTLNVTQPDYLKALDGLLSSTPLEDVRLYLR